MKENNVVISDHENGWKHGVLNFSTLTIDWDSPLVWLGELFRLRKRRILHWNGLSQKIGSHRMTIFRYNNQLHLLFQDQLIKVSESIKSELELLGNQLHFVIKQDDKILYEQRHKQIKSVIPIEDDPTPFVEAEDFDLRVLIHNTLNSKRRREVIFR